MAIQADFFGPNVLFSSVLPSARTGFSPGGSPITVFATVINAGLSAAKNCSISITGSEPVLLSYQLTDATNAPTGPANAPFDIDHGNARSFILSFSPIITDPGSDVFPRFICDSGKVSAIAGVNTAFLSIFRKPGLIFYLSARFHQMMEFYGLARAAAA